MPSVSEHMTDPVLTVGEETTLAAAAEAMDAEKMHSLVVITEDCRPAGVFTSTDLIAGVTAGVTLQAETVGDHMTRDVVTVGSGESIQAAAALMSDHDISHLPVVDDQVVGIVTETDLREYLAGVQAEPMGPQ